MTQNTIGNFMTVLGFLNGMIGGTILILPILGLKTGYIYSPIIAIVIGLMQFYTCYLLILHIGKSKSMKDSILSHFQSDYNYVKIYSFFVWLGFVPIFFIYFRLIVLQFQGLLGYSEYTAPLCAIALFFIILVIRVWHVGEETLAYGIASIITYVLFITWSQLTAPEGENKVSPFGQVISLTSTLIFAYSVGNVIGQNIFKNPNKEDHIKLVSYTFICGIIIYTYITFGSFSIVNRIPFIKNPETIEDYFERGGWQVTVIELLYVVHLFSAFPNFVIISKVRFYELLQIELKDKVAWYEVVYIFLVVMISLLIYLSGIHLDTLIQINGSVICYITVFFIPILIHLKCIYYDRSSGTIEGDQRNNLEIKCNDSECDNHYSSKWTLYFQTFMLIFICLAGLILMAMSLVQQLAQ